MNWKCVEFTLYYRCNVDCVFCSHTVRMERFGEKIIPIDEVVAKLKDKRAEGFNHVTFTGGEPTLYPHFAELLKICRLMGFRTRTVSNGWSFSVEKYAKKVLPHLDELCLSIHGATEESHDEMTGVTGGYLRMKGALETIQRLKPDLQVIANAVATTRNVDQLAAIAAWVRQYPVVGEYWISTLVAQGAGADRFKELAIKNKSVLALAREIGAAAGRLPVRFYGFPLCVLGDHRDQSTDVGRNPSIAIYRGQKKDGRFDLRELESKRSDPPKVKTEKCRACVLASACGGLWRAYYRLFGDAELETVREEVSAS